MKKKCLLLCVMFFSLLLVSCEKKQGPRVVLDSGWTYSLKDPRHGPAEFVPVPDDDLSHLERFVPNSVGYIWLQRKFELPSDLKGENLSVYLGRIAFADETELNGILIGKGGRFPANDFSAWTVARKYSMPQSLFVAGENILEIKIWVNGEGSVIGVPFIAREHDTTLKANFVNFFSSRIYMIFAFFCLVIALYHIVIYIRRPVDMENLAFGVINIMSPLFFIVFFIWDVPGFPGENWNYLVYEKIFSGMIPFYFPFGITSFINTFTKRKDSKLMMILRLSFMIMPMLFVLCIPTYPLFHLVKRYLMIMLFPPMMYAVYLLIHGMREKNVYAIQVFISFIPVCIGAVSDVVLHEIMMMDDIPYFSGMAWMVVVIVLLFAMAYRFANSVNKVEYFNSNLEHDVLERTKELSDSNKELEDAKHRADRDMKLAAQIQHSLYPQKPPVVRGWEFAFHFQPVAGENAVSGDLYDFYYDNRGECRGVGLFDTSSRGIAGGLVSMLAKEVIARNFREGIEQPLTTVANEIHRNFVDEKGDVETYLTGALLRFKDEKVEYINAAHPAIFYRSAKTGHVRSIESSSAKNNGDNVIGQRGVTPSFKSLLFSLSEGDSLIIYTDGLSMALNNEGKEFGDEGISKAFSSAGGGSASEKLKVVMNLFNMYVKDVPVKDDITVIIMQKTK